ncbi:MAG: DUF4113 domain-containing protein [Comamonas sp.]
MFSVRLTAPVRSSNYALYGDMSRRVNAVYERFADEVEVYSIDESFLDLSRAPDPEAHARVMRDTVLRWTGIPTCVGLGPTRVLAKAANHLAKKRAELGGVCDLTDPERRAALLATLAIEDVWGIGRALSARLAAHGVRNAAQLAAMPPKSARQILSVTGERIVLEMSGIEHFPVATNDSMALAAAAGRVARRLWADGFIYAKAGVMLEGLIDPADAVPDLWHTPDPRRAELMRAMDAVNMRYGRNMLAPAGVTYQRPWSLKQDLRSPRWTTRLDEVPTVRA